MALLALLGKTWKMWLPVVLVLTATTTIWAQSKRINTLKEQRNVAIYEHDRAVEQIKKQIEDIQKLNNILLDWQKQASRLQADYDAALGRIKAVLQKRPDIRDWADTRLPGGLWEAARGAQKSTAPHNTTPANLGRNPGTED